MAKGSDKKAVGSGGKKAKLDGKDAASVGETAALQKLSAFGAQFMAALGAGQSSLAMATDEQHSDSDDEGSAISNDSDHDATTIDTPATNKQPSAKHQHKKTTTVTVNEVEVTVFKDPTAQRIATTNKRDYKAFMSSKIDKINNVKPNTTPQTQQEQQEEIEDRLHDKELNDLLQSSNLIERIATEQLAGKDRKKYLQGKMIELGAKPIKSPSRLPFNVHVGIQDSRKKKVEQHLEEARNIGMFRTSLRRELEDQIGVKRKKEEMVRKDRGMKMAVGKYKNGALHISANELRAINREGSSSGTNRRGNGGRGGKKRKR
ncbi:hypothetical protein BDF19DRAFT_414589 [Syncephalis fuscata]|nr:hypothetical protein BDF19DRAFT_414589 [Syncephalis fuscata]